MSACQWCINNGYELVELIDTSYEAVLNEEDEEELEDDFKESLGFKRIQEALHANCWSNMKQTAGKKWIYSDVD